MLKSEVISSTLSNSFAESFDELIIDVSEEINYNRREMIEYLGCANFLAAYRLSKVLKRLNIFTIKKLYKTDPFSLLRTKGIGQACIYVAMCILDSKGYDVGIWWRWNDKHESGKFSTYKYKATRRASKHKQVA